MSGTYYRVVDWDECFETSESRKRKGVSPWVAMPTGHSGAGFTEFMDCEKPAEAYGAWALIVQVAAKCDERGVLVRYRGGRAISLDSKTLSRMVRVSEESINLAINQAIKAGWIEACGDLPESAGNSADPSRLRQNMVLHNSTEHNSTEHTIGQTLFDRDIETTHEQGEGLNGGGNGQEPTNGKKRKKKPYAPEFEEWWKVYPRREHKGSAAKAYPKAVAHICADRDVTEAEARQVLIDMARQVSVRQPDPQFQPHPASWLNACAFDDDPLASAVFDDRHHGRIPLLHEDEDDEL